MQPLQGVFVALWSPTDSQGHLLADAIQTNLAFIKKSPVKGILALGSTGEFLHFDPAARKQILNETLNRASGLPVVANISDLRPAVVADLGRFAREAGACAVAMLPPYFYPLAQEDLVEFFVRGAEAAQLPAVLYNFPERTGLRIELETIRAVAQRVPVVGYKQSGAEFDYHVPVIALGRELKFAVLTGADTRLSEAMNLGATGCVSGLANALPDLLTDLYLAIQSNNQPRAALLTQRMQTIAQKLGAVAFPLDVAAVMQARSLPVGLPKHLVSSSTRTRYNQLISELAQLFQEWNLSPL